MDRNVSESEENSNFSLTQAWGISAHLWWTCYAWIFKWKQPRIIDAELVTSLTLLYEETFGSNKILCLVLSRLSQESLKSLLWMVWEWWEGVALHIERSLFEAQCQRWFVHKVDGLHLTGWLVYLTARAASFLFLLLFWCCKVFFASSSKISDAHYLWILLTCQLFHLTPAMFLLFSKPCLYPPWQDIAIHSTAIKRAKHISGRITKKHGVKMNFSKHGILTA